MRALGKSQKLQKRRKLLQHAKEPEHVQRGLDEARLAEWKKWQKHSAADVVSVQEAARLVMEGAEEIGTQLIEVDRNEKVRVESEQAGEAKHVPMNLKSRLVALGNQERCVAIVRRRMPKEFISSSALRVPGRRKYGAEIWRVPTLLANACLASCC